MSIKNSKTRKGQNIMKTTKASKITSLLLVLIIVSSAIPFSATAEISSPVLSGNCTLNNEALYLNQDITANLTIMGFVVIDLNGHDIKGLGSGPVINMTEGSILTVCDFGNTGRTRYGHWEDNTYIIEDSIYSGKCDVISGGCITGGKGKEDKEEKKGGIYVAKSAVFSMDNGNIVGNIGSGIFNEGDASLSNVYVTGNINMNGYGGGIYNSGDFLIDENTQINNNKALYGGGIYNNGHFDMLDGNIENNKADNSGGGVCNNYISDDNKGLFTLGKKTDEKSGEKYDIYIQGNTANSGGGIENFSEANIYYGNIKDNSVTAYGGGISNDGLLRLKGGTISGNTVTKEDSMNRGAGIFTSTESRLLLEYAPVITDNMQGTRESNLVVTYSLQGASVVGKMTGQAESIGVSYEYAISGATQITHNSDRYTMDFSDLSKFKVDNAAENGCSLELRENDIYIVKSHDHISQFVEGKFPTCTEDGWKFYFYCRTCGKYFEDAGCKMEIKDLDIWKIMDGKEEKLGHDWGNYTYTWADDLSACTVTRTCTRDASHTETANATITTEVLIEPTCTEVGYKKYTATFDNDWADTQATTVEINIDPDAHDWSEPTYDWAEDGSSCTATRVCKNNRSHVETVTGALTSKITLDPTCTEKGQTTYTATFDKDWASTQTKILTDVDALDHDWDIPTYDWAEDGSSCTATRVCKRDLTHTETLNATVTSKITLDPTCTEKGQTTYTATFDKDWAATQTKVITNIEALNHDWGEPTYEWSEDGTTCTATRICKRDPSHTETIAATIASKVTLEPTCTEKGQTTYTATFDKDWTATQTKVITDVEALNHDWGEPTYEWSDDGTACTATRICKRDPAHTETLTGVITSEITLEPTYTENGQTTYTATFEKDWAAIQTNILNNIPKKPHGDLDGDGEITSYDYNLLKRAVLETYTLNDEQNKAGDINNDGMINTADYTMLKRIVLGTYSIS